ncbi:4-diphosphocytidyl-2-C-methyl-D-erythritol kinase [Limimonas halophila]|uniref:4-diphosphocytidyl-2-C-methyl-D-erythritol kinase n=1 Tax=Limimonas halophila TaxID=1082479 RepID=A0A1G7S195_9PROT|nr:4-(cytidine 5'-diphospho)-2-C-methyl-D-erythritol kinase [Limimonas halophila]SDG16724.1 4-diphosphocytidyl-2-C-methyl-D-erythritol kinase [Limimonas halophila]
MSDTAATAISRRAPAKLNLSLHVTGKRADGYHELDGLIAFADVSDTITAEPAETLSLTVGGPFAEALDAGAESNLVLRAARALAEHAGVSAGAALHLDKQLPVAAGLGGGSADAAATLRALIALWGVRIESRELHDLALALGADVPMCLFGRPAFVSGIGDTVTPLDGLPPAPVVLVNPGVAVPTPAVFRAHKRAFSSAPPVWRMPPSGVRELAARLSAQRNDLTTAAETVAPAIGEVLDALRSAPGCHVARMSGSGATCFGIFANTASAETAAHTLAAARPAWWVRSGRLQG